MPVHRAGMQIPDQHVKPSCTKSVSFALTRKSLQGALQLVLRPVKRAGIKFAPHFAKVFGHARKMRETKPADQAFEICRCASDDFDYLTASARQFHSGET